MQIFQEECERKFINQENWNIIEQKFEDLKNSIITEKEELKLRYTQFTGNEADRINGKCDELIKTRYEKYDNVSKQFEKFFDSNEL